ncbi:HTH cro/C1-type domain-containing protein [Cupriavidus sp. H19C3]|uniref:helix-turn-helix domain-containing protein n=1 Tax=Cupriavidus sp. H19C3 TaxID=3241603 RepID=UPI003BF7782E
MKTTLEYVDAVKVRLDLPSDYAIAKALCVSRQAVSQYRQGKAAFDDLTAVRVAEILGLNPMEVIAAANRERAKSDDARRVWTGLFDRFAVNFEALLTVMGQRRSPALA